MKIAAAALVLFTVFCCLEGALGYPRQRLNQQGKYYGRPHQQENQQGRYYDRPNAHTNQNSPEIYCYREPWCNGISFLVLNSVECCDCLDGVSYGGFDFCGNC